MFLQLFCFDPRRGSSAKKEYFAFPSLTGDDHSQRPSLVLSRVSYPISHLHNLSLLQIQSRSSISSYDDGLHTSIHSSSGVMSAPGWRNIKTKVIQSNPPGLIISVRDSSTHRDRSNNPLDSRIMSNIENAGCFLQIQVCCDNSHLHRNKSALGNPSHGDNELVLLLYNKNHHVRSRSLPDNPSWYRNIHLV